MNDYIEENINLDNTKAELDLVYGNYEKSVSKVKKRNKNIFLGQEADCSDDIQSTEE